ncbi:hypothetical protein [Paenibacillus sp. 481]|uniref:hypothetical protein n=1 Tax=Paenibacillus sp. 481 TaxID=2835869 RepID=UPI001E3D9FE2|nr:hypothetical protein [Paenibacillus sp. 481]UHA74907.1 hypothetical protein KIK04_07670 [Paenibacillus sp. 481]
MNVAEIKRWVKEHGVEEKCIESFWNYFNSYQDEYADVFNSDFPNYDASFIEVFIQKILFSITNWPLEDYNHIVVDIRVRYKERYAASYKIVYNLDGSVEDDYLSFD